MNRMPFTKKAAKLHQKLQKTGELPDLLNLADHLVKNSASVVELVEIAKQVVHFYDYLLEYSNDIIPDSDHHKKLVKVLKELKEIK